ncbi:hypothetical protein DFH06DRAFT_1300786 [Mycena polygramma]|nr:hypothetical protein DFH06DRAFT_1300786 [Mycena polygramma]
MNTEYPWSSSTQPRSSPSAAFFTEFASNRAYHDQVQNVLVDAIAEALDARECYAVPARTASVYDGGSEVRTMDFQQNHPSGPVDTRSDYELAESLSFSHSSGARSTPSDHYDEDAENIDPNSLERTDQRLLHSLPLHSRATNILRDSQAYPVTFDTALLPDAPPEDASAEPIAAPVPLPYSARSKEVLSAMISPIQPAGFPKPLPQESHIAAHYSAYNAPVSALDIPQESRIRTNSAASPSTCPVHARFVSSSYQDAKSVQASQTDMSTNLSSSAPQPHGLHHNYSREMAQYRIANTHRHTAPPRTIRPISPATLIALTEPFLMAWIHDYPTP